MITKKPAYSANTQNLMSSCIYVVDYFHPVLLIPALHKVKEAS